MCGKDWRTYDVFLTYIKDAAPSIEQPSAYFGKSGLLLGLLKTLKKRLNPANRDAVIAITIDILTKSCNHALRIDIHKFLTVELANSLQSPERLAFVIFCHKVVKQISRRYFAEAFLDSYMNLLSQERYQVVVNALL